MYNNTRTELINSLSVDDVKKVLTSLGAKGFRGDNKAIFITNTICHDGEAMKLYCYENDDEEKDKFTFHCYTDCSCSHSLFDIVMLVLSRQQDVTVEFSEAINYVKRLLGKTDSFARRGWGVKTSSRNANSDWDILNKLTKKKPEIIPDIPVVENEHVLEVFSNFHHEKFINDHISHEAMNKFEIKFYINGEKIVIPHRNPKNGTLMGIRGRTINQDEEDAGYKYIPLTVENQMYSFPSHGQLYGLWQNRESIKRMKKVVIFESEKSVLQCESYFKDNFTVALLGKSLSQYQVDMLLDLGVETVIFALDKEFEEVDSIEDRLAQQAVLKLAKRFVNYCRTFVIWDTEGLINYKDSPSDQGKETLCKLLDMKQEVYMEDD